MSLFGKILGGSLGFVLGGPIGAILGVIVGHNVDRDIEGMGQKRPRATYKRHQTTENDFAVSLLVLIAKMLKADGKVLKSELNFVKRFLTQNFGKTKAEELLLLLRDMLKQPIEIRQVCQQIRYYMQHSERLQILHILFGIAQADGEVHNKEFSLLRKISEYLGINPRDFSSIKEMYFPETDSAYKILEITKNAKDEEVKKAYRKMAKKYHPDRVANLGEGVQKSAKAKFQKLQEAYDKICKERGIV